MVSRRSAESPDFYGCRRLEFCPAVLAEHCIVRIGRAARRAGAKDDWHSGDSKGLGGALVQVELVALIASES